MSNYDEIFTEIAKKHGTALSKNDPILIVYTLNQRMIEDQSKAQEALFDQLKSELEERTQNWQMSSKEQAEKILTAALEASKKAMLNTMTDNAKQASNAVREEFFGLTEKIEGKLAENRNTAYINLAASLLTLTSVCLILWLFISGMS